MKGRANHIELHMAKPDETLPFYKDLLGYFEWPIMGEWPGGLGMGDNTFSIWFFPTDEAHASTPFTRDGHGIGHFGIHVESKEDVDTFVSEFLRPRGIPAQFDTPRAREDFGPTYYQVMFLDPEGLAIEVYHS
jgi:catechol 2,3-dioxygenase-like lactoylglutathione lyase family enzyme